VKAIVVLKYKSYAYDTISILAKKNYVFFAQSE
jgi:hypothetical protein